MENLIQKMAANIQISNEKVDLVLSGGMFNGSYLFGALMLIQELERTNKLVIGKISGCSIGAIGGFLYLIDALDMAPTYYEMMQKEMAETKTVSQITNIRKILGSRLPADVLDRVNGRLYISYTNVLKPKKIVKSHFKTVDDLLFSLTKSCFVPFIIDGSATYKGQYIDGILPFVFDNHSHKKMLYIELFSLYKIQDTINIRNEKTNCHRIVAGILDIHNFFIKGTSTNMCSYLHDWSQIDWLIHYGKQVGEFFVRWIFFLILRMCPNFDHIGIKLLRATTFAIFRTIMDEYCL